MMRKNEHTRYNEQYSHEDHDHVKYTEKNMTSEEVLDDDDDDDSDYYPKKEYKFSHKKKYTDHDDEENDEVSMTEDESLAEELLTAGIPRSRVKGLLHTLDEEYIDKLADRTRLTSCPPGTPKSYNSPMIKEIVEESKAPADCVDPLFMHLMKDPVVLSSGYVVDRNSILDEQGNLRFKRCPFTKKSLKEDVYPLTEKKKQIKDFKRKRDRSINSIARKLIAEGSFKSFNEVLEAVEYYLKDLGDANYLPLAKELADVWTGIDGDGNIPHFLFVDEIKGQVSQNRWHTAMESEPLEFQVGKILISANKLGDLGRGSNRNVLALSLYSERGALIDRQELFAHQVYGSSSSVFKMLDYSSKVVFRASEGCVYKLEYMVNGGRGSQVRADGLICKIFPASIKIPSYRMRDHQGEEGLFMGDVDSRGNAHGRGVMEYDDGKRFVGQFYHGSLHTGVIYNGTRALFTMKGGHWTPPPDVDDYIVRKYPQDNVAIKEGKVNTGYGYGTSSTHYSDSGYKYRSETASTTRGRSPTRYNKLSEFRDSNSLDDALLNDDAVSGHRSVHSRVTNRTSNTVHLDTNYSDDIDLL